MILVDGLGVENLRDRKGHARFLSASLDRGRVIYSGFPTTTAANILSFATGLSVGQHGFLGHQILDRANGARINLLSGWDGHAPEQWQTKQTLSQYAAQRGLRVNVIGPAEYQGSGYSQVSMPEVRYQVAEGLRERFAIARANFNSKTRSVTYLYIPELDKQAHRTGWESPEWTARLEELDSLVEDFATRLPPRSGVILTADHGLMDSPEHNRVLVDQLAKLPELEWFAGDSRASYLYLREPAWAEESAEQLNRELAGIASTFLTRSLVADGWYGESGTSHESRLPDLVMLAKGRHSLFHSGMSKPRSIQMVAHHGGVSPAELRIPLITWT